MNNRPAPAAGADRPPVSFRPGFRDRHGPMPFHVPAGPSVHPWTDPVEALRAATAQATGDAAAGVHDVVSLTHEAPLLFEQDATEELTRDLARIRQLAEADATMCRSIQAGAEVRRTDAEAALAPLDVEIARLDEAISEGTAELRGVTPYTESIWKAPERATESVRQTLLKEWGVLLVLLPVELGINVLALQLLPGTFVERLSFAVVIGLAAVWAGHAAGVWLAERRRATTLLRVAVPGGLALLVVAVIALMAGLRLAYVDRSPGDDPFTGQHLPSALSGAGVPGFLLWVGVGSVQLIFFAITVLHTLSTHNPRVRALQTAQARRRRLLRRRLPLHHAFAQAEAAQKQVADLPSRNAELWAAESVQRTALAAQRVTTYKNGLARALRNPDATAALEARAVRTAHPAQGTGRLTGLPASPDPDARPRPGTEPPDDPSSQVA